jgi:hypothetical protein
MTVGEERRRLAEAARGDKAWRQFGPYLAEWQWGTVREDYSAAATPGAPSRTSMRAAARTAGARTDSWGSATTRASSASRSRCGTTTGPPIAPARITAAREDASWQDDVPELQQTLP